MAWTPACARNRRLRRANLRGPGAIVRRCLRCEKPFKSEHKFNRLCEYCRRLDG